MWLVQCRRQALLPHIPSHPESPEWVTAQQVRASSKYRSISNPRSQELLTARRNHTVSGRPSRRGSEEVGSPNNVVTKCQEKQNKRHVS